MNDTTHAMTTTLRLSRFALTLVFTSMLTTLSPAIAAAVYKCSVNGAVAYQNVPCAQGTATKRPTVEQLNAERQQRLQQARDNPVTPPASSPLPGRPYSAGLATPPNAEPAKAAFRCDGRTHCSQMHSCAEAKYFLAHCPNVKMDGNHDGVPCEQQWCGQ